MNQRMLIDESEKVQPQLNPYRYDIFISYHHETDRDLARRFQSALQRIARPWYRRRSLRVFLDQTDVPATSDLPARITRLLSFALAPAGCGKSAVDNPLGKKRICSFSSFLQCRIEGNVSAPHCGMSRV